MTNPHANAIEAAAEALYAETISQPDGAFLVVGDSMKAAQAAVTAYLAAMEAAGVILCPVEPTQDMITAAWRREPKHPNPTEAYRAMIAARPKGDV